jgi:hypothetical protein
MSLPPLLSERPPAVRAALIVVPALVFGFLTGWSLAASSGLYAVMNVLAALGGVGGGFECDGAAAGARRGVAGGLLFGLAIVLADATVVDTREAKLPDPAIVLAVITAIGGALLGALGGALRARAMRRRAVTASG